MNWRKQFGYAWEDSHSPKWRHPADGIKDFISKETIEALIKDAVQLECGSSKHLNQQLRDKWLN